MAKGQQIQLFGVGVGAPGKSLNVTAANRTNVYYDIQPAPGDKVQVAAFGTPGLEYVNTLPDDSDTPISGIGADSNGQVYCVQSGRIYRISSDPLDTPTLVGSLGAWTGASPEVEMASALNKILIVGDGLAWSFTTLPTSVTQCMFTPSGLPVSARTCTFQDGYFIVAGGNAGDSKFYISGLYDPTSWNDLDYGAAEFSSDQLVKVLSKNSMLYLFGTRTIEVWQNIGDLNFPFQRITGATMEYGLISQRSVAETSDSIIGLFSSRSGDLMFLRIAGGQASNITPPDLAYILRQAALDSSDPEEIRRSIAFVYNVPGHEIYHVTFCGLSYCYDTLSGMWSVMKSGDLDRHIGDYSTTEFYQNGVTKQIVSAYDSARLYTLSTSCYTDDGEINHREIVGNHIFLPDRGTFRVSSISLDMEHGSSDPTAPMTVRLSLSRDGGHSFEEEYTDTSATGEYRHFAQFNRLGRGRDIVPKVSMSDSCKFVLLGAVADIAPYGW